MTHFTASTEEEGLALIRKLLSYIPQNNLEEPPYVDCTDPIDRLEDSLNEIIPDSPNKAYDMYEVIGAIVDNGEFLEVQRDFAKNIIIGFARFNGQSVGIVANQPKFLAGVLTATLPARGTFCPFLRCLQHSYRFAGRCAGIPAGNRTGIQCRYPAWCKIAVRLRRGYCA